ncbi:MAG: FeoA family protein [Candidatus Izemoplasmataceae bacterium]|jgi:ferrous iron transport protein A|uniref:FeoA family protein n=1 Tax=Liberiplasma polymorphum TaxID=3374570 RepID=UPI003775CCC6
MYLYSGKKQHNYILTNCPKDHLLEAIGVRVGLEVKIITKQPLGGPLVIRIKERDIAIDKNLASAILAKAIS